MAVAATLAAQGLNFAAMLLPILLGRFEQVAFLVIVSAAGGIAAHTGTLAFGSVYPALRRSGRRRSISIGASVAGLLLTVATFAIAAVVVGLFDRDIGRLLGWSAALCAANGMYIVATGLLIRDAAMGRFGVLRTVYACVNLVFTVVATFVWHDVVALAVAATAAFVVSAASSLDRARARALADGLRRFRRPRELGAYAREHAPATMSNLAAGIAYQSSALLTGLLGPFAGAWAVIIRITGGFATIGTQVVGPPLEMRFAAAVREGRFADARRTTSAALVWGLLLSLVTAGVIAGVWAVAGSRGEPLPSVPVLVVGAAAFILGSLVPCAAQKFLVMAGGQRRLLLLVLLRLVAVVAIVPFLRNEMLVVVLAVIEFLFAAAYVVLLSRVLHPARDGEVPA